MTSAFVFGLVLILVLLPVVRAARFDLDREVREWARAYGVEGIRVDSAAEFKPALEKAIALNKPVVIDVRMVNVPTPTAGHWNIMDIYSPGKKVHHVSTDEGEDKSWGAP